MKLLPAHGFTKDLWALDRSKAKTRNIPIVIGGNAVNAGQVNQYFAGISTDHISVMSVKSGEQKPWRMLRSVFRTCVVEVRFLLLFPASHCNLTAGNLLRVYN